MVDLLRSVTQSGGNHRSLIINFLYIESTDAGWMRGINALNPRRKKNAYVWSVPISNLFLFKSFLFIRLVVHVLYYPNETGIFYTEAPNDEL